MVNTAALWAFLTFFSLTTTPREHHLSPCAAAKGSREKSHPLGDTKALTSTAWSRIAPILPVECVTLLSSVLVKQGAVGHSIALLVVHSSGSISCFLLGANEEPIFNPCFGLCFSKEPWLRQSIIFFLLKSEQKQTGTEKLSTRVLRDLHLYLCAPFSTQPFSPHSHGRAAAPAALSSAWQEGRKGDRTAIG